LNTALSDIATIFALYFARNTNNINIGAVHFDTDLVDRVYVARALRSAPIADTNRIVDLADPEKGKCRLNFQRSSQENESCLKEETLSS